MASATKDHHSLYARSFLDIATGELLDVMRGRTADEVASWLTERPPAWRQRIEAVAIDPHAGYLRGILRVLLDVTVTVDHFHALRLTKPWWIMSLNKLQPVRTGPLGAQA